MGNQHHERNTVKYNIHKLNEVDGEKAFNQINEQLLPIIEQGENADTQFFITAVILRGTIKIIHKLQREDAKITRECAVAIVNQALLEINNSHKG